MRAPARWGALTSLRICQLPSLLGPLPRKYVGGEVGEDREQLVDTLGHYRPQVGGEAFPVVGGWRLAWWQHRESLADLGDGQADPLGGTDHGYPAAHVGEKSPVVAGSALAGQQPVVVVPAHRRTGDSHALGDLTDA